MDSTALQELIAQVRCTATVLAEAERPVIYAGQGVHYAEAYRELQELAELLAIPVCTSLPGKSAFDETHPLALGSGGNAHPKTVAHFLRQADVIFGIGCSFSETAFGIAIPTGKPPGATGQFAMTFLVLKSTTATWCVSMRLM